MTDKFDTFNSQGTENTRFRLFGTPGIDCYCPLRGPLKWFDNEWYFITRCVLLLYIQSNISVFHVLDSLLLGRPTSHGGHIHVGSESAIW